MESDERTGARLVATAVLGGMMFQPMVIRIFDGGPETTLFGVPIFYLYLFAAWAFMIAMTAFAILSRDGVASFGRDADTAAADHDAGAPFRQ